MWIGLHAWSGWLAGFGGEGGERGSVLAGFRSLFHLIPSFSLLFFFFPSFFLLIFFFFLFWTDCLCPAVCLSIRSSALFRSGLICDSTGTQLRLSPSPAHSSVCLLFVFSISSVFVLSSASCLLSVFVCLVRAIAGRTGGALMMSWAKE